MKFKSIFFFTLSLCFCHAQRLRYSHDQYITGKYFSIDDYDMRHDQQIFYYAPLSKRRDQTIHFIYLKTKNKKGKEVVIKQEFNEAGKLIYVNNPSQKYEYKASYLNDTLINYCSKKVKNKLRENKTTYENGKIKSYETYRDGKLNYTINYAYTDFNKPLKTEYIKKKKIRTMTYEYFENSNPKKITLLANGKVKKVWNYDCRPEGQAQANVKEEVLSSRCEYREENNDGSYTVFIRSIEKGKPRLTEKKYTKDSAFVLMNVYEKDSVLLENWYKDGDWEISTYYSPKGKVKNKYCYRYNKQRSITEYEYFSGNKLKYCYKNSYDSSGNYTKKERYSKPNKLKPTSSELYDYDPKGLMTRQQHFTKKRLGFMYEFEYVRF